MIIGPENQYINLQNILQRFKKKNDLALKYKSDKIKKIKKQSQYFPENLS